MCVNEDSLCTRQKTHTHFPILKFFFPEGYINLLRGLWGIPVIERQCSFIFIGFNDSYQQLTILSIFVRHMFHRVFLSKQIWLYILHCLLKESSNLYIKFDMDLRRRPANSSKTHYGFASLFYHIHTSVMRWHRKFSNLFCSISRPALCMSHCALVIRICINSTHTYHT